MENKFSGFIRAFQYVKYISESLENEVLEIRKTWKMQLEERKENKVIKIAENKKE